MILCKCVESKPTKNLRTVELQNLRGGLTERFTMTAMKWDWLDIFTCDDVAAPINENILSFFLGRS